MNKPISILLISLQISGCSVVPTFASISNIPVQVEGIGDVYRYEGRANFPHQIEKADAMLVEHCKNLNSGTPKIVSVKKIDLGIVPIGGGSTTSFNANVNNTGTQSNIQGTATTTSSEPTMLRNYNQEIRFICETE